VALKQYKLPAKISVVLNTGLRQFSGMPDAHRHQLESMKKLLDVEDKKHCLSCANYTKMLDLLLFIEEHQMCKDIRDYDREDMVLKRTPGGRLLELEVPGLAEHRPSVMVNDSVFVRESKQSGTLFEGYVHEVREASVLLKFSNRLGSAKTCCEKV
jgi:helicase MOV-10